MLEGVGVDVAAGHVVQQLQDLLAGRKRLSLALNEQYSLVPDNRDTPCKLIDFKFKPIAQKIQFFIWIKSSKTHSVNLFALCYNICTN